jgi:hypothetical protein
MRTIGALVVLTALGGCDMFNFSHFDQAPAAPIPSICDEQVYADPHVKDLLLKSAGSPSFARQHEDELKYAKVDAAHRCMQQKGILPPGGGVERPAVRS